MGRREEEPLGPAWRILLSSKAQRDIRSNSLANQDRDRIVDAIERLGANPQEGKMLKGSLKGFRSTRAGEYRILYNINPAEKTVLVFRIAHRRDVYRR